MRDRGCEDNSREKTDRFGYSDPLPKCQKGWRQGRTKDSEASP